MSPESNISMSVVSDGNLSKRGEVDGQRTVYQISRVNATYLK